MRFILYGHLIAVTAKSWLFI